MRLGDIGSPEALKALVDLLEQTDAGATLTVGSVLSEVGPPALPYLKDYQGYAPVSEIRAAIEAGKV